MSRASLTDIMFEVDVMTDQFVLGLIQLAANADDRDALEDAELRIRDAAAQGAQIMVLPELFRAPYFPQDMTPDHHRYAEAIPGPTTERLAGLAHELSVVIVASLYEEAAPGLYFNTTAVLDADGSYLGKYRKMHIPDDPLFYEKFYFTPGDNDGDNYPVFHTQFAKIGVLICWDQWFPEAARLSAMNGAEVLVYPTAIATIEEEGAQQHAMQKDAWRTAQRAHAISNGIYVAAVNRAGTEGQLDFWGGSFACGPQGEILQEAGDQGDETLIVTCERQRIRDTRHWWPYFRDRRIDSYAPLLQRWGKNR